MCNVPTWQRRANFSAWCANVPRRTNILTLRANVLKGVLFFQLRLPKDVPIFQLFFKRIMLSYIPNKFIPNIFYTFCIFIYIPNIYFLYEYIFLNLTLSSCVRNLFRKTYIMHTINLSGKAYIM